MPRNDSEYSLPTFRSLVFLPIHGETSSFISFIPFPVRVSTAFVKCGCLIYFFPQFCRSDMSGYGYPEVFQRVPWISRFGVDCSIKCVIVFN